MLRTTIDCLSDLKSAAGQLVEETV